MKCPKCGAENPENAKFCRNCGFEFKEKEEKKAKKDIDKKFPLIKLEKRGREVTFAWGHIHWDPSLSSLIYEVHEPRLSRKEQGIFEEISNMLKEKLEIPFTKAKSEEAYDFLVKKFRNTVEELGYELTRRQMLKLEYYIYRNFIGLGKIEPIMHDPEIEDISCDGVDIPIFVYHRNPKLGEVQTNIMFNSEEELNSFVLKLAQKCGKSISVAQPLLDGSLPDGSVDWNSRIVYQENGKVKTGEIGKLIDRYYEERECNKPKQVEDLKVPAFDSDYHINWRDVEYVYRHKNEEKLYKIRTEFGKKVKLTGAHSIFVLREGEPRTIEVSELKEEDWVVIPKEIPMTQETIKEINLAEELASTEYSGRLKLKVPPEVFDRESERIMDYLKGNYEYPRQAFWELRNRYGGIIPIELYGVLEREELEKSSIKTNSSVEVPAIIKVDSELLRILGYYIAEGWIRKTQHYLIEFSFNQEEEGLIKDLRSSFKNVFNVDTSLQPDKNAVKVIVDGLVPWLIFKKVLKVKKGAENKLVPELVFNVPKKLQREFFKAWWDGDYGYTVSKELASDMQYLKLFDGNIISFNKRRQRSEIDGREIKSSCYYTQHLERKEGLSYPKMIPIKDLNPLNSVHFELGENERYGRNRIERVLEDERFERFRELEERKEDLPKQFFWQWKKRGLISEDKNLTQKGKKVLEELGKLKKLKNSDLAFAKVKEIERVEPSTPYVYDISVRGDENFMAGFGGICCHNSRVQATYGTDIARRGSNFTIRKFTENPLSPIDEMDFGTINAEIFAYLWMAVENQLSILCSGGTATGKCVSPNTKIQLVNGERKEAKKIFGEYGGKGQGWTKPKKGLKVLSLDPKELKIKEKRVSKLWKLEGKEMLSFKLNNSQIKVTPEHPFFTIREGELRKVRADELEEGERVAIAKRIPVKSKAKVSIPNADGAGIGNSGSDIFLDEIQEIENTGKEDWVYDLTVPGTHNFLAGEGIPLVISNTAMLNALSLFVKPDMKVVSIEDTPELRLPLPNWVPEVSRTGFGMEGSGSEVTMFDLLKASLRKRPDYIIVGEVRGKEANVMFQGMATGHPGLGTIHADSFAAVIDRLTTRPINLPRAMLENLDIVVFMTLTKAGEEYIRRVDEVVEILEYSYKEQEIKTNQAFEWVPRDDKFKALGSVLLDRLQEKMGYSREEMQKDLRERVKILQWMYDNDVSHYEKFSKYIRMYYYNKERLLKMVEEEEK